MNTTLFDRISNLLEEITNEKRASARYRRQKRANDPGTYEGESSHPSADVDDGTQEEELGEHYDEQTEMLEETVDRAVTGDETDPEDAPEAEEVQMGDAELTDDDPDAVDEAKERPEADSQDGELGGTDHPASTEFGEKYSSTKLASATDKELFSLLKQFGNQLAREMAGVTQPGVKAASVSLPNADSDVTLNDISVAVVDSMVKSAEHQADLVASFLEDFLKSAQDEEDAEDEEESETPEDELTEEESEAPEETEEEEESTEDKETDETAEEDAAQTLLDMMATGPEAPAAAPPVTPPGVPPELAQMSDEEALAQLASVLTDMGVQPTELAEAAGPLGEKLGSAIQQFKRSGRYEYKPAKTAAQRKVRAYMKHYLRELLG